MWLVSGDNSLWITHIATHLGSEALTALCSRLSFQWCLHIKLPRVTQRVCPFRAKSIFPTALENSVSF